VRIWSGLADRLNADLSNKVWTIVLQPVVLLQFLRERLERLGVKFLRTAVNALADLKGLGHDYLINASGLGALKLTDVPKDPAVESVLSQLILAKFYYDKTFMRHGKDYSVSYTHVLPRLDGTAILGGTRAYGATYVYLLLFGHDY
jgi:D-amino-acid oxidase